MLVLANTEYRYLWVDVGSSGSSSDTQMFNSSKLRKKIHDGTLGLPLPEPLGEEGPDLQYFLLCYNTFMLMPWLVKPYSRRQLTRKEGVANYRIFTGRRVVENAFSIQVSRFGVLLGTMEQMLKVVRDIILTCVVFHNILRTQ